MVRVHLWGCPGELERTGHQPLRRRARAGGPARCALRRRASDVDLGRSEQRGPLCYAQAALNMDKLPAVEDIYARKFSGNADEEPRPVPCHSEVRLLVPDRVLLRLPGCPDLAYLLCCRLHSTCAAAHHLRHFEHLCFCLASPSGRCLS